MSNDINATPNDSAEEIKALEKNINSSIKGLSMSYILEQIEWIATQSEYLGIVIERLGNMDDGENGECGSPGNTSGQAKAQALGDVVRCRETTNQQLLKLYEKMYDDLKQQSQSKSGIVSRFEELANWLKTQNRDEYAPGAWSAIEESVKAQLSRSW